MAARKRRTGRAGPGRGSRLAGVCLGFVVGLLLGGLTPWATALVEGGALPDAGRTVTALASRADDMLARLRDTWGVGIGGRAASERDRSAVPADAGDFGACAAQFPPGAPVARLIDAAGDWQPRALCSEAFAVLYSARSRTPLLVAERLDRGRLADAGGEARTDVFRPDTRLAPGERAELSDYAGSGFDRGHMAPAADQPDARAMSQSFVLSNVVPQDPTNNREAWSKIEADVRHFARRAGGPVYVYTGPLFDDTPRRVGRNRVWVPDRLFKLVYDASSGRAWAYVLPNSAGARVQRPMDYAAFVHATGWDPLEGLPVGGGVRLATPGQWRSDGRDG